MVDEQDADWNSFLNKLLGPKMRVLVVYDSSGKAKSVGRVMRDSEKKMDVSLSPGEKLMELEVPHEIDGESILAIWSWMKAAGLDDIGEGRSPV